jgi:hypothetical protein
VYDYTEPNAVTSKSKILSTFVEAVRDDLQVLYVCDDARYQETTSGDWEFQNVVSLELFYELGFRNGDQNAYIAEWDPVAEEVVGQWLALDSLNDFFLAWFINRDADGVIVNVERSSSPTGKYNVKVELD